jgi:hypothetical protein
LLWQTRWDKIQPNCVAIGFSTIVNGGNCPGKNEPST